MIRHPWLYLPLPLLVVGGLLISATSDLQCAQPNSRPNVVLFLVDDYGYGDIGFEGNTQIATPNIDRIAYEGTRFSRFYQSAGACAPTRAALLTGRDFFETGVWGVHWGRDFIHRDENTIGDLLQSAGYRTGVFGKWHSGKTDAYFGWNRGFDTNVHTLLYEYFNTRVLHNNRIVSVVGPITDEVGDQAVNFIRENQNRPFLCYIPFQAVHEPFNCPPESRARNTGHPSFERKKLAFSTYMCSFIHLPEDSLNPQKKVRDDNAT